MNITDLPNEVILKLFSYFSIQDLGNWTKVSKRFRNICWDQTLPYGKEKNISEKAKAVEDSIRDTEVAIKRLKNNMQAWRASVTTSRSQQGQPELAGHIKDLVTNTELEISKVATNWLQLKLQQRGEWFPFQLADGGASQSNPRMQGLQQLLVALNNPNHNTQQRQQQFVNILRAHPNLMAEFLKHRKQVQQQHGGASGQ